MDTIDRTQGQPRASRLSLDAERKRRDAVLAGAEGPAAAGAERQDRAALQSRMDAEMAWWNAFSKDRLSPSDEFGTL